MLSWIHGRNTCQLHLISATLYSVECLAVLGGCASCSSQPTTRGSGTWRIRRGSPLPSQMRVICLFNDEKILSTASIFFNFVAKKKWYRKR